MPELPEVETVARDLRGAVTGRRIEHVTVDRPDIVRYPDGTHAPCAAHRADLREQSSVAANTCCSVSIPATS